MSDDSDHFSDSGDEWCAQAVEEEEQRGAGHVFRFHLAPGTDRRLRNFQLRRRVFDGRLEFNPEVLRVPDYNVGHEVEAALQRSLDERIREERLREEDYVHFSLQHPTFVHAFHSVSFPVQEWNARSERVNGQLQRLADKLNSNEQFGPNDQLQVQLTTVRMQDRGAGGRKEKRPGVLPYEYVLKKRSVIIIQNTDELCCARALVTMRAWTDEQLPRQRTPEIAYTTLRRGHSAQERLAKRLHADARVPEGPCGLSELTLFQIVLSDYHIKVFGAEQGYQVIFGHGEKRAEQRYIFLLKKDHHYHGLTSIPAFAGRSYYCHLCDKGYDHEDFDNHPCIKSRCVACKQKDCADYKRSLPVEGTIPRPTQAPCNVCCRSFYGERCLEQHRRCSPDGKVANRRGSAVCAYLYTCKSCRKQVNLWRKRHQSQRPHKCGEFYCKTCNNFAMADEHQCFIPRVLENDQVNVVGPPAAKRPRRGMAHALQVLESNKRRDSDEHAEEEGRALPPYFVYADYECTQDEREHVPILICAAGEDIEDPLVFYGGDCTAAFYDWVQQKTKVLDRPREVIILFHNLKGYDGIFVLKYLYDQRCEVRDQISVGTKTLSLRSGRLTFKDSLCFLPFPLSAFADTFGLQEDKKGFFPHLFNTKTNQDYVGPWPDRNHYDPDSMMPSKRREFDAWYDKVKDLQFNLYEEMVAYCKSDIKVLKAGCEIFVREFESKADFNPLAKCVTIASACMRYYRKLVMPSNLLALEPPWGWSGKRGRQSHKAHQWLEWCNHRLMEKDTSPRIRHAFNGGEQTLLVEGRRVQVDGFDATANTVYEFHGCLWHGCPRCYPGSMNKTTRVHPDRTKQEVYQATCAKETSLRMAGYMVVVEWECVWDRRLQVDADLQAFLQGRTFQVPSLNPRDAFFGGRTNACQLYAEADVNQGEEIRYVDVTSLYPTVNKYDTFPVKYPQIITQPVQDIQRYFGIADCTVVPPMYLYHPVLPYRCGGKVTFPLCRQCVEEELPKPLTERSWVCKHKRTQRSIRGTWCTPELVKAQEKGYEILQIHEVYHFPPEQRKTGLFSDYINTWLKDKTEASGWPPNADGSVKSMEEKREFILAYQEREGIRLDIPSMVKNKGKKATAKLALNSFWGKFGERENKQKVVQVTNPSKLYELVKDETVNIHAFRIMNDECLEVSFDKLDEDAAGGKTTNIFIAAFTTCWARLRLYHHLDTVERNALYFDTDSVIYKWWPGQPEIPLGNFLGDMTDELDPGDGTRDFIVEFVSCGPKNYGYRTNKGNTEVKVRGFTLNVRGQEHLHFDSMKHTLMAGVLDPQKKKRKITVPVPFFIRRDAINKTLTTVERDKTWGVVFDKRVVSQDEDFNTLPYGYAWYEPKEDKDDHE